MLQMGAHAMKVWVAGGCLPKMLPPILFHCFYLRIFNAKSAAAVGCFVGREGRQKKAWWETVSQHIERQVSLPPFSHRRRGPASAVAV